jgi:hypothetical protein
MSVDEHAAEQTQLSAQYFLALINIYIIYSELIFYGKSGEVENLATYKSSFWHWRRGRNSSVEYVFAWHSHLSQLH